MIRLATAADGARLAAIYAPAVTDLATSFELTPPDATEMARRVTTLLALTPWLVAEVDKQIAGYAYASRWKDRSAYRYAVESTVYLDPAALGVGFGSQLYETLLADLRGQKLHTVIGGIALPNEASTRLHEKFGFRKVAHFKEVGYKFGQWVDVGYWQLTL